VPRDGEGTFDAQLIDNPAAVHRVRRQSERARRRSARGAWVKHSSAGACDRRRAGFDLLPELLDFSANVVSLISPISL
jgi:hypothetical protein